MSVLVSAGLVSGSSQTTLANGPQQSGCVTPIGLVGWWGGNGNSNDVLKNNAKLMGVATYGPGPYSASDQAFDFSGNIGLNGPTLGYVYIPPSPALNPGLTDPRDQITVDVWIRTDAKYLPPLTTGSNPTASWVAYLVSTEGPIFKGGSTPLSGYALFLEVNPSGSYGYLGFHVLNAFANGANPTGTGLSASSVIYQNANSINVADNSWHHVAAVYTGSNANPPTITLYIDGHQAGSPTVYNGTGSPLGYVNYLTGNPGPSPLMFGAPPLYLPSDSSFVWTSNNNTHSYWYTGELRDVELWDRALLPDEIATLAGAGWGTEGECLAVNGTAIHSTPEFPSNLLILTASFGLPLAIIRIRRRKLSGVVKKKTPAN